METSDKSSAVEILGVEVRRNIEKNVAVARQEWASNMQRHLIQCINKADCSDVVFVCKDENEVHASRILCMGRSEMLCAMFSSGMSECKLATVKLPEIKSGTLLSILEYLYTGDIIHYRPKDWKMGFEVIAAARFFILSPSVDPVMEAMLLDLVKDIGEDLQQAAMIISKASECKALHLEVVGGIAYLLRDAWMLGEYACQFSEEAVDLILKRTKCRKDRAKNSMKASLDEYFRFRGVLNWALCSNGLAKWFCPANLFDEAIPAAKDKLYCLGRVDAFGWDLVWLPEYEFDHEKNQIFPCLPSHESCRQVATRLLANIDWLKFPSQVFIKIVEPLKLVPDYQLMKLFRSFYINGHPNFHLDWILGKNMKVLESQRGLRIQSYGWYSGKGFLSICELLSNPDNIASEWSFNVEEFIDIELGFAFCRNRAEVMSWEHQKKRLSAIRDDGDNELSRTLRMSRKNAHSISCSVSDSRHKFGRLNTPLTVKFSYDHSFRQCCIEVGSEYLGSVWKDLPRQTFVPALWTTDRAKVTIAVSRGFDLL